MADLEAAEKKKIIELIKKSKDRQLTGMMDWMYTREKINSEDFLLGKKVDEKFEKGDKSPPKEDDVFGERIKANIALDMQAKMREDPLYAIKKREEESKRKVLNNPVRLKELQKMIAQQKKEKKKKKHKHKHGSTEDDLLQQYLSILSQKHKPEHKHKNTSKSRRKASPSSDSSDSDSSSSSDSDSDRHRKKNKTSKPKPMRHRHDSSDSDSHRHRNSNSKHKRHQHQSKSDLDDGASRRSRKHRTESQQGRNPPDQNVRTIDSQKSRKAGGRHDSSESDVEAHQHHKEIGSQRRDESGGSSEEEARRKKLRYGLIKSARHKSRSPSPDRGHGRRPAPRSPQRRPAGRRSRSRSPVRISSNKTSKRHREPTPPKRKLTDEERQQRLQEMMDNAKWRDEQRKTNVHRYREEDRKEEESEKKKKGSSASFLNPMLSEHATSSSVEERLKRNKYNIQRTKAALDKNFTKH